jgi:hypothetical protein
MAVLSSDWTTGYSLPFFFPWFLPGLLPNWSFLRLIASVQTMASSSGGVAQGVECLPNKHEVHISNPSTAKKEKKKIHQIMVSSDHHW